MFSVQNELTYPVKAQSLQPGEWAEPWQSCSSSGCRVLSVCSGRLWGEISGRSAGSGPRDRSTTTRTLTMKSPGERMIFVLSNLGVLQLCGPCGILTLAVVAHVSVGLWNWCYVRFPFGSSSMDWLHPRVVHWKPLTTDWKGKDMKSLSTDKSSLGGEQNIEATASTTHRMYLLL